jgi:hypothetical protein
MFPLFGVFLDVQAEVAMVRWGLQQGLDWNSNLVGEDRDLAMEHTGLVGLLAIAELAGVVRQGRYTGTVVVEYMTVVEIYLDMGEPVRLMLYQMTVSLFRG